MTRRNITFVVALALGCGPGSIDGDADADTGETGEPGCEPFTDAVPPIHLPDTCEPYLGDPPPTGTEVEVVIANARDEPILLLNQSTGCQPPPQWFLLDGEFQGHAVWLPTSVCENDWPSCRSFTDGAPSCSLCSTVHQPIYIEPGGRFVISWTTVVALEVEFPAACTSAGESVQCWAPNELPPGNYQLRAVAGLASDCASSDCSCDVDDDGSCVAPDFPTEANLEAGLEWSSECDRIELTFAGQ